ncbi:hypothetical protein [Floridanema aerugineum]|uniref:Uncharacterized protein n=1 Tax=Floridaenema aerugineum BLCC-F46 TaxID=3153654 RepID=A0ABV4X6X1_9CYAN
MVQEFSQDILLTHNTRDFINIPDLQLEDWLENYVDQLGIDIDFVEDLRDESHFSGK